MSTLPQIRCGAPGDAAGIVTLEALFPGDRMAPRSVRHFLRSRSARVWVVEARGEIVAALVLLLHGRARRGRIYSLAVRPDWRGHGLARRLLSAAEVAAADAGYAGMTLEVRADNAAARALYGSLGYREAAQLPGQYDDGAAGLRLRRDFSA